MYAKGQDGKVHNPIVQLPVPWWSDSQGSQFGHGNDHYDGHLKPLCMDHPAPSMEAGHTKGSGGQYFTISSGDMQKTVSEQSANPGSDAHVDLANAQQMIFAKYPCADPCYGLFSSTYGPDQLAGRIMLPVSMTTDGPIYVNAKQYHGIIRRRKSRAKAELENKLLKARKPYLHESRHRHAVRRARGTGGRFLGTKNPEVNTQNSKTPHQVAKPTASLNSDSKDTNVSISSSSSLTLSGSEVTSTFPRGDFNLFHFDRPSACSLASTMGPGRTHCYLKV